MDGAIAVERGQLASLLLVMCAAATTPAVLAAVLKLFFAVRLRSRLVRNHSSRFAVSTRGRQVEGIGLPDLRAADPVVVKPNCGQI